MCNPTISNYSLVGGEEKEALPLATIRDRILSLVKLKRLYWAFMVEPGYQQGDMPITGFASLMVYLKTQGIDVFWDSGQDHWGIPMVQGRELYLSLLPALERVSPPITPPEPRDTLDELLVKYLDYLRSIVKPVGDRVSQSMCTAEIFDKWMEFSSDCGIVNIPDSPYTLTLEIRRIVKEQGYMGFIPQNPAFGRLPKGYSVCRSDWVSPRESSGV